MLSFCASLKVFYETILKRIPAVKCVWKLSPELIKTFSSCFRRVFTTEWDLSLEQMTWENYKEVIKLEVEPLLLSLWKSLLSENKCLNIPTVILNYNKSVQRSYIEANNAVCLHDCNLRIEKVLAAVMCE